MRVALLELGQNFAERLVAFGRWNFRNAGLGGDRISHERRQPSRNVVVYSGYHRERVTPAALVRLPLRIMFRPYILSVPHMHDAVADGSGLGLVGDHQHWLPLF